MHGHMRGRHLIVYLLTQRLSYLSEEACAWLQYIHSSRELTSFLGQIARTCVLLVNMMATEMRYLDRAIDCYTGHHYYGRVCTYELVRNVVRRRQGVCVNTKFTYTAHTDPLASGQIVLA